MEALERDREAPAPLLGLAPTALAQKNFPEAVAQAKASLNLLYFQPFAHYHCSIAHYRLGEWQLAEKDLLVCIHQAPLFTVALRMLSEITRLYHRDAIATSSYQLRLRFARQQLAELRDHKAREVCQLNQVSLRSGDEPESRPMPSLKNRPEALVGIAAKDIIMIVSGLPRSGTSLMMQLLESAGLRAFTDGKRLADASNPKGQYEHEGVTSLLTKPDKS